MRQDATCAPMRQAGKQGEGQRVEPYRAAFLLDRTGTCNRDGQSQYHAACCSGVTVVAWPVNHIGVKSGGGSVFKKSAKVTLSAAAVENGGKFQAAGRHPPTRPPSGRQSPPRGPRGGYFTIGANSRSSPLRGAYLERTPRLPVPRRLLGCWACWARWDGGNPTRSGPAGGAVFRAAGCLGFGLHSGMRVRGLVPASHCHLLNLGFEGSKGVTFAQLKLRRLYSRRRRLHSPESHATAGSYGL